MIKLPESSSNSNPVLVPWITQVEDCLARATHAQSTRIDSVSLERSLAVWRENLQDRNIEVDDARQLLDVAVIGVQTAVRERDRDSRHLSYLEMLGSNRGMGQAQSATTSPR